MYLCRQITMEVLLNLKKKRRQRHNPGAQYEATRNSGLLAVWIMGL